MNPKKTILDMCCGSRMFYFDRENEAVVFGDIRSERHTLCDGRNLEILPDIQLDFRDLPFGDEQFEMVIFDPPHLEIAGKNGWMFKKYGRLSKGWREDLAKGFSEGFRVLEPGGVMVFKRNETQIKTKEILALTDVKPIIGHISGKRSNTHWILFKKVANVRAVCPQCKAPWEPDMDQFGCWVCGSERG